MAEYPLLEGEDKPITAQSASAGRLDLKTALAIAITLVCWASAFAAIRAAIRPGAYAPGHLALLRFLVASTVFAICSGLIRMRLPELCRYRGRVNQETDGAGGDSKCAVIERGVIDRHAQKPHERHRR